MRASALPTRRNNSVWTSGSGPDGRTAVDERIDAAEAFYAPLGKPARFQVSPASQPPGLDARLAARGYAVEAPTRMQAADAATLATAAGRPGVSAEVLDAPREEWLALAARRGRFVAHEGAFLDLLARLRPRAGFALARVEGAPAATAIGVCDGAWCGVFSMSTLPERRRRGAAHGLLAALAAWARPRGTRRLYLQVETDNAAALALYAAAGFSDVYTYHYRTRSSA
jgi:GNAT superfamily N-acetyltransferase